MLHKPKHPFIPMKNVKVEVKNQETASFLTGLAEKRKLTDWPTRFPYSTKACIFIYNYGDACGDKTGLVERNSYADEQCQSISLEQMIELLVKPPEPEPIKVELNLNRTAIVYHDRVEVGCEKFSHEAVCDLSTAVYKMKEKCNQ